MKTNDLDKVYGSALPYLIVLRLFHRFKSRRDPIEDDSRTGRPFPAFSEKMWRELIAQDYTVEELTSYSGMNSSAVCTICTKTEFLQGLCQMGTPYTH